MARIDISQYASHSDAERGYFLTHTTVGRCIMLGVFSVCFVLAWSLYVAPRPNPENVVKITKPLVMASLWTIACWLLVRFYNAFATYGGSHKYSDRNMDKPKSVSFEVLHSDSQLRVIHEDQSSTYNISDLKIVRRFGNAFIIHKNKVHMIPWTPIRSKFVDRLESHQSAGFG